MSEIDGMDMLGFLRVRAWSARKEKEKKQPRHAYIDQVWQSPTDFLFIEVSTNG